MGALIRWKAPTSAAPYDFVRVWRSDTQNGTYSKISEVAIAETQYYDIDGTTTHWYKIDFYYSTTGDVSALSDPIQGGDINLYCSVDDVRNITNITSSDLTDTQICNLIQFAGYQVNADVQIFREDEEVRYIDSEKSNELDGTNDTFYTGHWPLGDLNNDFEVSINDLDVYTIESDGTRTTHTVSSINASLGQFVLSTPPATNTPNLFVTYYSAPIDMSQPHPLIKIANALLAAAWAYTKLNVGKAPRFRTAALTVFRDMDAFRDYYRKYIEVLNEITTKKHYQSGTRETMYQFDNWAFPITRCSKNRDDHADYQCY